MTDTTLKPCPLCGGQPNKPLPSAEPGSYPKSVWYTPEDNSSREYIRDDIAQGWEAACKNLIAGSADDRDRALLLMGLLERAREYVTDSLEAHEHSDGRELLSQIDAALQQPKPSGSSACNSIDCGGTQNDHSANCPYMKEMFGEYLGESTAQVQALRDKLRNVISHATGGACLDGAALPLNDIAVQISQHHNRVWQAAQEAAQRTAKPQQE